MKIRNYFLLTSLIVFLISSASLSQTDTSKADSVMFQFEPKFYCVQAELCLFPPIMGEAGGLIDVDLFRHDNTQFIGIRGAFEYYGYGNPGGRGKSFRDICMYGRVSLRFTNFSINTCGGLAYHTGTRESGEILLRGSFELKYIPFGNFVGVMLKGSTSFWGDTGFIGLGIALGYFN